MEPIILLLLKDIFFLHSFPNYIQILLSAIHLPYFTNITLNVMELHLS